MTDTPNPDPVFQTRAELEAWAKDMAGVIAIIGSAIPSASPTTPTKGDER